MQLAVVGYVDKLDSRKRRRARVRESSFRTHIEAQNMKSTRNESHTNARLPLSNISKFTIEQIICRFRSNCRIVPKALEYISDSPVKALQQNGSFLYLNSDNRNMHENNSNLATLWSSHCPPRRMQRENFFRRTSTAKEPRKTDGEKIDEVMAFFLSNNNLKYV